MNDESTTTAFTARKKRWPELKEILADALECEDTRERLVFLQKACAGDTTLLRETKRLLGRNTEAFEAFAELAAPNLQDDAEDIVIGQRLGAYSIIGELGRGGMGAVYLAERADGQFAKKVALKVLKRGPDADEVVRRFRIERQILARLEHPNITRLLDAGTTETGLPYCIMEFVDGAPVTTFAAQHGLERDERVALFLKICGALDFAHRHGVVHRDIKPSNILIGLDGEPKLLDFGIAKIIQTADEEVTQTLPLYQRLTPKYASPEQRAGNSADASSDIYSLGAILLELLTNDQTRLNAEYGRVVTRAMAADPALRYLSAADLARDLTTGLDSPNERFSSSKSRRFIVFGGIAAATLALLFGWPLLRKRFERSHSASQPVHAPESIAVLPFRGLGPELNDASLGLGMADAIIAQLGGIKQLRVLPTTSVARYKIDSPDVAEAGTALGVDAVLCGTVQRAGEKIRVTVQLVDMKSKRAVWAQTFDQTFTGIFEIQDAIAENVTRLVTRDLSVAEQKQIEKRATLNPEAYDAYTMGLYFWSKRTEAGLDKAIEYLERATSSDPQFARAYALEADSYYLKAFLNYGPATEMVAKSRTAAERAIAIDPSIAEAHLAMSTIEFWDDQPKQAMQSLRRALELSPNLAIAHQRYGWTLCSAGKLNDAIAEIKRAVELDPLSPTNNSALGGILIFARNYSAALGFCSRAVELEPANPVMLLNLGWVDQLLGRYNEAIAIYEKMGELDRNREGDAMALKAAVLYGAGRGSEANDLMPAVMKFAEEGKIDSYNLTLLHVMRGEIDQALEVTRKTPPRERCDTMLEFDPLLDPLRKDQRFAAVVAAPPTSGSKNQ